MLSIIIIVIVILIYFSYTFYKYWNNNKIEKTIKKNEIKNSIISENFKNEKKITKEPNLIIQIKYKDEVYNDLNVSFNANSITYCYSLTLFLLLF